MKRISTVAMGLLLSAGLFSQDIKSIKMADLQKTIAESKTPMIINFWATYCVPCVEEIPYFQEEVKKYKAGGLQLLLVSLDLKSYYPDKVRNFVKQKKFTAAIAWLNESDADYFCPKIDPKWSGALPATLFVNNKTGYRKFFEEQLTREKLQKEIAAVVASR